MKALGINAAILRGRYVDDPDNVGAKMCLNRAEVEEAIDVGADIEKAVCGLPGAPQCPFRARCGYQKQKPNAAKADVVIAAHQHLFQALPNAAKSDMTLTVADESWWQAGLEPNRELADRDFLEPRTCI